MLRGINPLLTPELLMRLAQTGHNEWVAVVDANFTAELLAGGKPVIRLPGISLAAATAAIISVFPVCNDVPHPAGYMHVSGATASHRTAAQQAVVDLVEQQYPKVKGKVEAIERFAFYERVKQASIIVQCGETSAYGNALFCKDVILPAVLPA
jgi:L-fucose mutarotase